MRLPLPVLVASALSVALTAALAAAPVQAAPTAQTASSGSPARVSTAAAARALDAARDALSGASHRDATLALRDLRVRRGGLSTADRASADALLARPIAGRSECFTTVCVHWSTSGVNAASNAYVQKVASIAEHVLATYVDAGYRMPEDDGIRGGNGLLDIYLEDLGSQGLYGYCDSDGQLLSASHDTWAFCAFDNDYAEFPSHTPTENLEVTAAHELFHAVQFGYDANDDTWAYETTATWAEDELYDGVDDNLQYLPESPLGRPGTSMDRFDGFGVQQYGDWIFFRYLTERFAGDEGGLPVLVRDLWERADASSGGEDDYSVQAISKELAARETSLSGVFADFAAANRRPGASYEEGAANHYPAAPLAGRTTLAGGHRDSGVMTRRVDHLASKTIRFTRGSGFVATRLELTLDLPPTAHGSQARVTVYAGSGRPRTIGLSLSADGNATKRVAFASGVRYVEVTLSNGSVRYDCGARPNGGFSCAGRALDDDLRMTVRGRALR